MTMSCIEVVQGYRHSKIDAVRSILGWALCVPNAMSEFELCETYSTTQRTRHRTS